MLFCCHQTNKRQLSETKSEENKTKSSPDQTKQEPHIYEDIDGEDELPELPDREYLTDIDFVAQEFSLILCRPPDVPERSVEDTHFQNNIIMGGRDEKHLDQLDTCKLDCESHCIQELSWKTTALARPNKYNITVPNKHVNKSQSHNQTTPIQTSIQHKQIPYTDPVTVVKAKKTDATMLTFNSIQSPHQQPVTFTQKSSHTPGGHRQLPHRQTPTVNSESMASQMLCHTVESPTYQNVSESTQTPSGADIYQNVTGDQRNPLKDEESSKQQRQPESTYQPLLFGNVIDEDEYMDFDRF